jgi:hypothetical protein
MAKIIRTTGKTEEIISFELPDLQKAVGGYIEIVNGVGGYYQDRIVCNEEGHLKNLPVNKLASMMAGQQIVGDVVVAHRDELD